MKLNALRIDPDAVENGRWVADLAGLPGLRLKVRGLNNIAYRRMQAKLQGEIPLAARASGEAAALGEEMMNRLLVETVLLDWEGITDDNERPIPFAKGIAAEWLADPSMRRFREAVIFAADIVGDLKSEQHGADAKN